jgi:hypothetical protein
VNGKVSEEVKQFIQNIQVFGSSIDPKYNTGHFVQPWMILKEIFAEWAYLGYHTDKQTKILKIAKDFCFMIFVMSLCEPTVL